MARAKRRGEGMGIKDLDYGVECTGRRRRREGEEEVTSIRPGALEMFSQG